MQEKSIKKNIDDKSAFVLLSIQRTSVVRVIIDTWDSYRINWTSVATSNTFFPIYLCKLFLCMMKNVVFFDHSIVFDHHINYIFHPITTIIIPGNWNSYLFDWPRPKCLCFAKKYHKKCNEILYSQRVVTILIKIIYYSFEMGSIIFRRNEVQRKWKY